MNRFFVNEAQIENNHILITSTEDIRHISKVLRLREGDRIEVSDSQTYEYEAEICSVDSSQVVATILNKRQFNCEPVLRATLFQAIPKQGKMETIIQKAVELGVYEVVPVLTERAIVNRADTVEKKRDRWQKVAAEAVKQCKRGKIPTVGNCLTFSDMEDRFHEFDLVLFPYEEETGQSIKDVLRRIETPPRNVAILIGPEGGFSKREAEHVVANGGIAVSLGKTILRTETAGPAALAMLMYEWEL